VGPQSLSEQTLLGEGSAELDAKRQAKEIGLCGETPEKISVSRLPITGSAGGMLSVETSAFAKKYRSALKKTSDMEPMLEK